MSVATQRKLVILAYRKGTPTFGSCSTCGHKFFTPVSIHDSVEALEYLEQKFVGHKCSITSPIAGTESQ
jgi:hypothetical protein